MSGVPPAGRPGPPIGDDALLHSVLAQAGTPPAEFGLMPFWFWNDDLQETELLRQLRAFQAGGMGGVVIHPRIGLSRRIGYLTAEYLRLVRRVVDECAALGLKVILYDEGSYPSGSACGQVVAEDPERAARALVLVQRELSGPSDGYWRPAAGRSLQQRLVCAVLAPLTAEGAADPAALALLQPDAQGLVRLTVGAGAWRAMACLDVPSGGTIRGVHPEQEDGSALAPPAADLLRPDAVAAFIRLTHSAYAAALGAHMGTTVVALFTDEPDPLGRGARRGAQPYTPGLERDLAGRLGRPPEEVLAWLPALWTDYGLETAGFRRAYAETVRARLRAVFYGAQAAWCAAHGLALTGHPAASDDMATLADFHWPGQDMVWRWVLPGTPTGLEGAHSVAPKAAVSAARAGGRRRAAAELFGAYGWGLSLDEAKWLLDWHLARGINLLLPHACFYSLWGGRAHESEPDVGPHNPWWRHFTALARYAARLCWLLTDCEPLCKLAVIGDGAHLPWAAARTLYEAQEDFYYVDWEALERAEVQGDRLRVGAQAYREAILDGPGPLPPGARATLEAWLAGGGRLRTAAAAPGLQPPDPGLRLLRVRRSGLEAWLLFNEGETEIRGTLTAPEGPRHGLCWDALRGDAKPFALPGALRLPRRESRVLLLQTGPGAAPPPPGPGRELAVGPFSGPGRGDWARQPGRRTWSGTASCTAEVVLAEAPAWAELDLGAVGEAAEVWVNGQPAGCALWAPYVVRTPAAAWHPGRNRIEVAVTNSAANTYDGALRPSGLLGPVRLRLPGP